MNNFEENKTIAMDDTDPYFILDNHWSLYHNDKIQRLNYPGGVYSDGKLMDYNFNNINVPWKLDLGYSSVGGGILKLESKASKIILNRNNIDYFEVYNGIYAVQNSAAIEKLSGTINAFKNGIELQTTYHGKTMESEFTISIDSCPDKK